jgi:hypothetical protein
LFLLGVLALRHFVSGGGADVFKSLTSPVHPASTTAPARP